MIRKVEDYVSKWNMLKKDDKIIVGVSGGADSVCLLFVLLELRQKIPFDLVAVHVNHGLRGKEADDDERFVKTLCREQGVLCVSYLEDVSEIAKTRKLSLEEAGRDVRRELFFRAMEQHGGTKIALAHHMNDNVETFFMNAARGTGLKGLGGIRPVSGVFIRPLLCLERKEIEVYLQSRQIKYCTDCTNATDEYMRNRVRNHLIPYMEQEMNSQVVAHISETMSQLQQMQLFLEEEIEKYFEFCVKKEEKGYIFMGEKFHTIPEVIRPLLFKKMLVKVCGKEKDLTECHLQSLMKLMQKQVGRKVDLPYEMEARRTYDGVWVVKAKEQDIEDAPVIEIDFSKGETQEIYWQGKHIVCRLLNGVPKETEKAQKSNTKWFDYDIISHKLAIRGRRAGDYITIHSSGKTQKIKAFFINEKIPQKKRNEIMLLVDGQHVLWVEGFRTNCFYEAKENTKKVLEIQVDEGERDGRDN